MYIGQLPGTLDCRNYCTYEPLIATGTRKTYIMSAYHGNRTKST